MRARRCAVLLLAAFLSVELPTPVIASQLSSQQDAAQDSFFATPGQAVSLHDSTIKFPDGAKGFEMYPGTDATVGPHHGYSSADDRDAQASFCDADAVVRARAGASIAHLAPKKDMIVTATTFVITDNIKPAAGANVVGDVIDVVRKGGEVVDQGAKLRVVVHERADYRDGQEYLLFLKAASSGASNIFHAEDASTLAVDGDTFFADGAAWHVFRNGDSYTASRAHLTQLVAQNPCSTGK